MTHTDRVTRYGMTNEKKSFRISLARERLRSVILCLNQLNYRIRPRLRPFASSREIKKDCVSFGIPSIVNRAVIYKL